MALVCGNGYGWFIDSFLQKKGGIMVGSALSDLFKDKDIQNPRANVKDGIILPFLRGVPYDPRLVSASENPLLLLNRIPIASPGNLMVISGLPKTGKSHVLGTVLASTIAVDRDLHDVLGFCSPNPERKAVIYLDCEQSVSHFNKLVSASLKRVGVERKPDWLYCWNMSGSSPHEIIDMLELLICSARIRCNGIHQILIDGYADLVTSPNDEGESVRVIRWLNSVALQENCAVVGVLHYNSGTLNEGGKMRGHLGSQIERKAETVLTLQRHSKQIVMYSTRTRGEPVPKESGTYLNWDCKASSFVTARNIAKEHKEQELYKVRALLEAVFSGSNQLRHKEVVAGISQHTGVKSEAAKKRISQYLGADLLIKNDRLYSLGKVEE